MRFTLQALAALALAAPAMSAPPAATPANAALAPAARGAAAVVDAFHAALRAGNREAALALLADDVLILEGGGAERSKAEYAAHHLASDSEFTRAVPSVTTARAGQAAGGFAWVATEGRATGTFKGRAIARVTAETMVLRHARRGWRIVHIHWSSANPR